MDTDAFSLLSFVFAVLVWGSEAGRELTRGTGR